MTLNKEERDTIVAVRLQRSYKTMSEAISNIENNCWHTAANRLYYACYYAVCALLIKNGITAHTHVGAINQLGLHFVRNGIINNNMNKFYRNLYNLRQDSDYDDWIVVNESDIKPLVEPAEKFIAAIESLINNSPTTE